MRRYLIDREFAEWMARRRRQIGWSQQALAEAIGGHEALIAKWETRRLGLSPESRERVEAALSRAEQGRPQIAAERQQVAV